MPIYIPWPFNSCCSPLPIIFFVTLVSANRYIVEHSLLVDQRDMGSWKAFEETVISQKDDLFYKAGLKTSTSGLKQLLAVLDLRFLHSQVWSFRLPDMLLPLVAVVAVTSSARLHGYPLYLSLPWFPFTTCIPSDLISIFVFFCSVFPC